jgi:hypothetical protein
VNHSISVTKPFSQYVLMTLLVSACASHAPVVTAQFQSDGSELGAAIVVQQANPLQATITIRPQIAFRRVVVEVANDVAGSKLQCRLERVVERQLYSCPINGIASPSNSALVVVVTGIVGDGSSSVGWMTQKKFSVPNPSYDSVGTQKKQDLAEDAKRLETINPPR